MKVTSRKARGRPGKLPDSRRSFWLGPKDQENLEELVSLLGERDPLITPNGAVRHALREIVAQERGRRRTAQKES